MEINKKIGQKFASKIRDEKKYVHTEWIVI